MSRRRNPAKRAQARTLIFVCTGAGAHPRRELGRYEHRVGRQIFDGVPVNADGKYERTAGGVVSGEAAVKEPYGPNGIEALKGIRIRACPEGCPYDGVLKDETIARAFPMREGVGKYEIDVSGGATIPKQ